MQYLNGLKKLEVLLKKDIILLSIFFVFVILFYSSLFSYNSTHDDNLRYINIGRTLAEEGKYIGNFWNSPPLVPFMIFLLYSSGVNLFAITFIIPLFFIILFLIANFYLFRTLYNRTIGYLVMFMIITLPSFLRWASKISTDLPSATFAVLSMFFFYLGIEKERKHLVLSSLFFVLSLLSKISGIMLVIVYTFYILYRRKLNILKTKEFLLSISIATIIPSVVMAVLYVSDPSIFSFKSIYHAVLYQGQGLMIKFFLNPLFLFVPLGIWKVIKDIKNGKNIEKEHMLIILAIVSFLFLFTRMITLMRYLTVIYGMISFLSIYGLFALRKGKLAFLFVLILSAGLIVGFINTVYLMDIDNNTRYGVYDVAEYISKFLGNEIIAAGMIGKYLTTYTSKNIVLFPTYVDIDNKTITYEEYFDIITNPSNPNYNKYVSLTREGKIKTYVYFDEKWLRDNNVSYVIWSLYDDFSLNPREEYYNIKYAGIELPIKRPYNTIRPPPDFVFSSEIYKYLESSNNFEVIKKFYKNGQKIIIIYKYYF